MRKVTVSLYRLENGCAVKAALTTVVLIGILWFNSTTAFAEIDSIGQFLNPLDFLPPSVTRADFMVLTSPQELHDLSAKFQENIRKEPDWWMAYVEKATPGTTLPYHEKMGLSEAEYDRMVALFDVMTLQKSGEAHIRTERVDSSVVEFRGDSLTPELEGIRVDLDSDQIHTRFGIADRASDIESSSDQNITGPWTGVQWKLQTLDTDGLRITDVKFALGRLKESNTGILYYKVTKGDNESGAEKILYMLYWRVPE